MLTTANRCRTGRSIPEAPVGQPIVHFQDLRLTGRLLAPEGEEADLVLVQIHLTADQAIGPRLAERPTPPQQGHRAAAAAAPQENQPTARTLLQVQLPPARERLAVRGCLQPRRPLLEQGVNILPGMPLHVLEVGMPEARPDL